MITLFDTPEYKKSVMADCRLASALLNNLILECDAALLELKNEEDV